MEKKDCQTFCVTRIKTNENEVELDHEINSDSVTVDWNGVVSNEKVKWERVVNWFAMQQDNRETNQKKFQKTIRILRKKQEERTTIENRSLSRRLDEYSMRNRNLPTLIK